MAITVRELIRLPHLRFTLLAGHAGLDREVSWVHTSDLPEPWKWHSAGEMLLSNTIGLPTEETEQMKFLERLSECGASGLGIGLGLSGPPLLDGALRRAEELALPLLTVPLSTPFTAVVRAVADANSHSQEESRQLWRVSRLYELLRTSVADGGSGQELFRKLGEELGVRLSVVDPATGHSLFGEGECGYATELAVGFAAHGNELPAMFPLRSRHAEPTAAAAVAVAMPGEHPTALVVESADGKLPGMVLLHHVATGAALELARLTESQQRERRLGANLLTRLLERRIDSQAAQLQLAELGLDLAECVLIAARPPEDGTTAHRRLAAARIPHALLYRESTVCLLLPAVALPAALAAETWQAADADPVGLGVSDLITVPSRVPDAAQEARWALAVASASASGQRTARYGDDSMTLPPRTPTEARVLVSRILSPLISHDARHGTEYVTTLRVFLRTDRSWRDGAAELHIHRQTLGYRLRKIEQLTGRGVSRTDDIAQWWLALRARDLLAGQPEDR